VNIYEGAGRALNRLFERIAPRALAT